MWECFKKVPYGFIAMWLFLFAECYSTYMIFFIPNWWFICVGLIILIMYRQYKLLMYLEKKCAEIVEAHRKPTGLYYKDGKPVMTYMDYPMALTVMAMPFILILATIFVGMLGFLA